MNNSKLMSWSGIAIAVSGVLHWLAIFTGPAGLSTIALLAIGAVYLAFGYGLNQQKRSLAYLCFIIMLMGSVVALAASFESWAFGLIAVADTSAAIFLFLALWQNRSQPTG
ncbi:MAG: hypothetical protein MK188_09415 [Gammaproteobacteria bacterium]|nr:hypothetical protein [Gammaproteobacteria bacterium]